MATPTYFANGSTDEWAREAPNGSDSMRLRVLGGSLATRTLSVAPFRHFQIGRGPIVNEPTQHRYVHAWIPPTPTISGTLRPILHRRI